MKVLILKPSSLGDVIHALPVLRLIKQAHPEFEIHWWIESSLANLLEGDPDLTGVIRFHRQRWSNPLYWGEACRSLIEIRDHRFDWVIDLQSLLRSAVVAWMANGAFSIGLDDPREGARLFFDVAVPRPSHATHAVDWYLKVLPRLGVPVHRQFEWLPIRAAVAASISQRFPLGSARWVALQPGARWMNKRWPVEHFMELVRLSLKRNGDLNFLILGGAADSELGRSIASLAPARCLDLTGKTTLTEMIEWVRLSQCLVTNDSGPMHVAAALGRPIVPLFGPTDPRRTGPYGQQEAVLQLDLPCVPCMKSRCSWPEPNACLRQISPLAVLGRMEQALLKRS